MPLIPIWKDRPEEVRKWSLRQIVSLAGDGRLIDDSGCSSELRTFLSEVDADDLERFVAECLEPGPGKAARKGFENSGLVLQDLVNEIGRRLEFSVTNGVYQGRPGLIGYDGIWRDGSGTDLVIEVKTTDTYSIPLDTIDRYRRALVEESKIAEGSSVLFVVGRDDTGALEAQIRGSRHAWTMRMIGAASLVRLMQVKVNADSPLVVTRIRSILRPIEYTRVDGIVDLMFEVRADTEEPTPEPPEQSSPSVAQGRSETTSTLPSSSAGEADVPTRTASGPPTVGVEAFRQVAADRVSNLLEVRLTRRRRSLFEGAEDTVRAVVSVSKRYERDYQSYWYAFYDTQRAYLNESASGYLVLCAADTGRVWAIPSSAIEPLVERMNATMRPDGQTYWHILTKLVGDDCVLVAGDQQLSLTPYEARQTG